MASGRSLNCPLCLSLEDPMYPVLQNLPHALSRAAGHVLLQGALVSAEGSGLNRAWSRARGDSRALS